MHIPLNHKTIILFDHSTNFATACGHTFDFDAASKGKSQATASSQAIQQLEPLDKSLWTCLVESAIEFSRIVYDIFPENKLISFMTTKYYSNPLNGWNDIEQNIDHVSLKKIILIKAMFYFMKILANECDGQHNASI